MSTYLAREVTTPWPRYPTIRSLRGLATATLPSLKRLKMEQARAKIYSSWTQKDLISRILELESTQQKTKTVHRKKPAKKFDPSLHSTRHIALRLAYLGGAYTGFEYHANSPHPTRTVEEQLFRALLKARLVASNGIPGEEESVLGWPGDEAVGYSKCGRTDTGVSAFGQVIGVRVRSNRPLPRARPGEGDPEGEGEGEGEDVEEKGKVDFDDAKDELQYCQILNRLLPHDIRVLAWCPNPPPNFSARFNCQERRYRYFFTNPAIASSPTSSSSSSSGTLNIPLMRQAASLYIGNHDFRNFCKLDASKQISRFYRIIHHADIVQLPQTDPAGPSVHYFELHGTAFLWHQVRHMVAILFLVAQELEQPSLITSLLDVSTNPRKPVYEMADDRALVLWDCVFPEGMLQWVNVQGGGRDGRLEILDDVWAAWHKAKIDEVMARGLTDVISAAAATVESSDVVTTTPPPGGGELGEFVVTDKATAVTAGKKQTRPSQLVITGGHEPLFRGRYVPVLEREKMDDVEVINKRYAARKGSYQDNKREREAKKIRKAAEVAEMSSGNSCL